MIELGSASEAEMVLAFVQAELDAPAYQAAYARQLEQLGWTREALVDQPAFGPADIRDRAALLQAVRGYGANRWLFQGFPSDVLWRRVGFESPDLSGLRYARCPPWTALAPRSLTAGEGARNLETIATAQDYRSTVHAIAARIRQGDRFPPLVLADTPARGLILIEGHTRATAYVLQPPTHPVEGILGASPSWSAWAFY